MELRAFFLNILATNSI